MEPFVSGQLENASSVLINKIDCVDEDCLDLVTASIRGYKPGIHCYSISAITKFTNDFWEQLLENLLPDLIRS